MNERPIINVIYQDPRPTQPPMGCFETLISVVVLFFFFLVLVGFMGIL